MDPIIKPVRAITTFEGRFLSLEDMREAVCSHQMQGYMLALMKVGHDKGDEPAEIIKHLLAGFLMECAGQTRTTEINKPKE